MQNDVINTAPVPIGDNVVENTRSCPQCGKLITYTCKTRKGYMVRVRKYRTVCKECRIKNSKGDGRWKNKTFLREYQREYRKNYMTPQAKRFKFQRELKEKENRPNMKAIHFFPMVEKLEPLPVPNIDDPTWYDIVKQNICRGYSSCTLPLALQNKWWSILGEKITKNGPLEDLEEIL